jgi:hypothetical protein
MINILPISATHPEDDGRNRFVGIVDTDKVSHLRTTNLISAIS